VKPGDDRTDPSTDARPDSRSESGPFGNRNGNDDSRALHHGDGYGALKDLLVEVFRKRTDRHLKADHEQRNLGFLARFFHVLVGVAIVAVLLVGRAEETATDVLSSLSDGLTSTTPEEAALASRILALSELAHGMLLFAFAAIIVGMALAIAAGARKGGPVSLPCLGAGIPALLYLIASASTG